MGSNRDEQARRNRDQFPAAYQALEDFREMFGPDVAITYAEEGDRRVGKLAEDRLPGKWVGLKDIVIVPPKKEEK
jgi:hypothetical protein